MPVNERCYTDPQRQGMSPVPSGGSTGQVLVKDSSADGDTSWGIGGASSVQFESFVATAGQQVFTFNAISYTVGVSALEVYINGVRQNTGDFSETSDTSIAFGGALDAGDVVSVYAVTTSSIEDGGTYNQGSSGAVDRTVVARLRDAVYASDFGVVGGEAGDDAAAIQAAVTASVGKCLKFSRSTYLIGEGIDIPADVHIDFCGSTIKRKAGSINAGPSSYMLKADGVTGVVLKDLVVDGNKSADSLAAENSSDRFGGLVLDGCSDIHIDNLEVTATVNAEDTCGLYIYECSDVWVDGVRAHNNDRSGVYVRDSQRVTLADMYAYSNLGSGVTSFGSDECKYLGGIFHDNGYSQLSVNGLRCAVDNILSYNGASGYSGLNVGHDAEGNRADQCNVSNVISRNNEGWGITIFGSEDVQLNNIIVEGNEGQQIRIFNNASRCMMNNVIARNSGGLATRGISIESGTGHKLDNIEVYGNAGTGIYVGKPGETISATMGPNVRSYNNGQATSGNSGGLVAEGGATIYVYGGRYYDNQTAATQETGIWLAGCNYFLRGVHVPVNKTYDVRETSSPTEVVAYDDTFRPDTENTFTRIQKIFATGEGLIMQSQSGAGSASIAFIGFDDANGDRVGAIGKASGTNDDVYIISDNGGVRIDGDSFGVNGVSPVAMASHIADPSGGSTTDAEARGAINAILAVLENVGLVSTS